MSPSRSVALPPPRPGFRDRPVARSDAGDPTALPAATSFTVQRMTDEDGGGTMNVVVLPAEDAVLAIAQEGDAYPRIIISSNPGGYGIAIGDGTMALGDTASINYGPFGLVLQGGAVADTTPIGMTDPAVLVSAPATFDDFHFIIAGRGPILIDRTTSDQYRLFVDSGVLGIELV